MRYTLFIDESGGISPNDGERYFCIGGYLIKNKYLEHRYKMLNIIKKVNKNRDKYFNFYALKDNLTEVKFARI
ncbi:DUF3800 domain-containing protein [Clostridium sp. DSM 100503]|uniref:DUF3800 domain-containing protein n=1 Tax=Clostridium sp. DSM 100503 TaxID=2963282 RepID=UPI002149A534|nr:DUF3800 domain-containing protein [Clostridium sp. DSM 100503]MCR1953197.1 DUF3800 domain-containing protein [Clostridium sp. DSM 100503]